jgi:hypothetical protein
MLMQALLRPKCKTVESGSFGQKAPIWFLAYPSFRRIRRNSRPYSPPRSAATCLSSAARMILSTAVSFLVCFIHCTCSMVTRSGGYGPR